MESKQWFLLIKKCGYEPHIRTHKSLKTLESYICHSRFEFQQPKTNVGFTNTGAQYIQKLFSRSLFDFSRLSSWSSSILNIMSHIKLVKSSY